MNELKDVLGSLLGDRLVISTQQGVGELQAGDNLPAVRTPTELVPISRICYGCKRRHCSKEPLPLGSYIQ